MATYLECDRCGCTHRVGGLDTRHIITTTLIREEQNDESSDLCDECYRAVKKILKEKLPIAYKEQ